MGRLQVVVGYSDSTALPMDGSLTKQDSEAGSRDNNTEPRTKESTRHTFDTYRRAHILWPDKHEYRAEIEGNHHT